MTSCQGTEQDKFHADLRRPATVQDIQDAVGYHTAVRANGAGHSWNKPFFCSNVSDTPASTRNGTTANIQLSTIRPLEIFVNETEETATVTAGVIVIDLLNYLGNYVTETAPLGWTLPAFPWFVYQTIAGAVATGTHGSSLRFKSLSSQAVAITMVLANGTLHTFTNESDPFLMSAARLSVGKLGIITSVKLTIVREQPVKRTLTPMTVSGFLQLMEDGQAAWLANGTLPDWLDESEYFWLTQQHQFMAVTYERADADNAMEREEVIDSFKPDNTSVYNTLIGSQSATTPSIGPDPSGAPTAENWTYDQLHPVLSGNGVVYEQAQEYLTWLNQTKINTPMPLPRVGAFAADGPLPGSVNPVARGTTWQNPHPKPPNVFYAASNFADGWLLASKIGLLAIANNATLESHDAYIYQPEQTLSTIQNTLFDQYEVSVAVSHMGDCMRGLLHLVYGDDLDGLNSSTNGTADPDYGFRTAPLIRFIGREPDILLSHTQPEPAMYINVEDYVYYNQGRQTNTKFKAVIAYLRSSPMCGNNTRRTGGGMHWGKAGWPDAGCWHGDDEHPDTWCDFGCAVRAMDPTDKFQDSAPDRWTWDGVDLEGCCTPTGFNHSNAACTCNVKHQRAMSDCPPPPYYTYR